MPKHVFTSAVVFGAAAWVVAIGVIVLALQYSHVVLPGAVGLLLIAAGVSLLREVLATPCGRWSKWLASCGCLALGVAALRVWGVF